jgi:hypothetical protein
MIRSSACVAHGPSKGVVSAAACGVSVQTLSTSPVAAVEQRGGLKTAALLTKTAWYAVDFHSILGGALAADAVTSAETREETKGAEKGGGRAHW